MMMRMKMNLHQQIGLANTSDYKRGSIGPPPTYDGSRDPGVFEEYRIRAKLCLFSTNIENCAKGPRLMRALSGRAFESVRHLILDATDTGERLIELLSRPEYYGKEEFESMCQSSYKLVYTLTYRKMMMTCQLSDRGLNRPTAR